MTARIALTLIALSVLPARGGQAAAAPPTAVPATTPPATAPSGGKTMELTSTAFADSTDLPARFTSDGPDVSPPLAWSGAPAGTKSLALIVDDPDAPDPANPKMTWVHWVLYDLPAGTHALAEDAGGQKPPKGTRPGLNDWKQPGYRGPSPPVGRHRYFFKLYALDAALPDLKQPTKAGLEKAMKGHVLAEAQLIGLYAKSR